LATQDECAAYAGAWTAGQSCGAFICSPTNLVRNPGAETSDLSNWTITGGAWSATYDSRVHSGRRSFATTSSLGTRTQTIDLVTAGYPATLLDTIPTIIVGDWVASRADQGARYFVQFDLLDASQAVLATWSHGTSAALIQIPANTPYFQETNTFTGYPAGVRFIKITEGGRDVNGWAGFYGAHFDDAFAGVVVYNACCLPDSTCIVQDMASCLNAGGTRQSVTSCTPSPCAAANGACCRGSTCVIETSANCTGANSSYKGDGTVCNLPGNNTTPCCRADFNQSGSVTVQDIFDFLGGYFSVNPWADINGSGAVTVQDIFDFLAAYFAGCI
jgi:hypothetical protein